MVKIFGVSARVNETWTGREGYGIDVDIYKGRTKLGNYRDEADGSMPYFEGDTELLKSIADKYFTRFPPNLIGANIPVGKDPKEHMSFCFDENAFIEELLSLTDDEKLCRKSFNKGYKVVVFTKYPIFAKGPHPKPQYVSFPKDDDKAIQKWIKAKKAEWPLMEFAIYRDLSQFKIE